MFLLIFKFKIEFCYTWKNVSFKRNHIVRSNHYTMALTLFSVRCLKNIFTLIFYLSLKYMMFSMLIFPNTITSQMRDCDSSQSSWKYYSLIFSFHLILINFLTQRLRRIDMVPKLLTLLPRKVNFYNETVGSLTINYNKNFLLFYEYWSLMSILLEGMKRIHMV